MSRLRPALPLLLLAACAPAPRATSAILITLDTTRADALGCYGGPQGTSPNLDALAAESVVFDAARTVAPITLPAHASMLTGLYPPRHTLRDNARNALPASARTLAEAAGEAGYETAAFVSAVVLDASYGLAQGFDVYRGPASDAGQGSFYVGELSSEEVVGRALAWWRDRDRERPFFLWVHLFDPHAPYAPAQRFAERAPHPYLGEIMAMDEALGMLLDRLRADGALDECLTIVVADHGEGLGDHDEPSHGVLCYEPTIRVPLLVRPPASIERVAGRVPGKRTDAVASVADVYPTVVEALDLDPGGAVDGVSLLAAPARTRGAYFETFGSYLDFGWSPLFGWADRSGKYVHGPAPELFDPKIDPREERDLTERRAADLPRYRDAIVRVHDAPALAPDDAPGGDASRELLEGIRDLGYTASGEALPELPGPLDDTGLPSPTERSGELLEYARAMTLLQTGHEAEAADVLRGLVRESPRNFYAHEALAKALFDLGEPAECVEVLEAMLELRPSQVLHIVNLGLCRERLEQPELAEQAYRRALELEPDNAQALRGMVRVLTQAGRQQETFEFAERLRNAGG